ncbi:bifunctional folylpolyglutamate synthase/dihydrofolate synthase [Oleispirillum naphthae]|uniref:bifunctional folylpolyglutamate synthase/dihydrofolate synthase n=1 Tax=Oleispirillum naphthae TaxID=2838853 RepID=UPI00308238B0
MLDAVLDRFTRLHPRVIDLSLARMWRLLADLGNPQQALPPVIHVAGTNGKGSAVATLSALFAAAGRRAHAYTSPHLVRFAERVRIAGALPSDEALAALLEEVEAANAGQTITFFEATTAAALLAFARAPAEACLLETGLGGRLDATNVVARPRAAVLTAIAYDHQDFLGNTLTEIATEKAHILRPGVPAVIAAQPPEAMAAILRHAEAIGAVPWRRGVEWEIAETPDGFSVAAAGWRVTAPQPVLLGPHQVENAALALVAAHASGLLAVTDALAAAALPRVSWPGRLQRLGAGDLVAELGREFWVDGGHNPSAAAALAPVLAAWAAEGPVDLVLGMQTTKDPAGYLAAVAPHLRAIRTVPVESAPAPFAAAALADAVRAAGHGNVTAHAGWRDALAAERGEAGRLLAAGSLYLVGEILAANRIGAPD